MAQMKVASLANSPSRKTPFALRTVLVGVIRMGARICVALALIAAITAFFSEVVHVNATTVGFLFLLAILIIATAGGLLESTIASVVAMLCFNFFFLPPMGTLTIADPQNWIALFAFLATSLIASQLSARAKRETKEAIDRRTEMERLYSVSRGLLLSDPTRPMAAHIVQQIARLFDFSSVALYERRSGELYKAGQDEVPDLESRTREAVAQSSEYQDAHRNLIVTPIRLGGQPVGALALAGARLSDAALESLLNLVAIGLERAASQAAVTRAEVARESEELKSTLLDAIAHEFKTPLTSIKAATTDLLSETSSPLQLHQRELVGIADEEADRLSRLVTEAIQLARIEGGKFRLNRAAYFPSSLIASTLKQLKPLLEAREINVSVPDDLPPVWIDAALTQLVIAHLIDNALKYSPSNTAIHIGARPGENNVVVSVSDLGAGISPDEQARIFDKFYRGRAERTHKGTGMGLSIAREIIHAQGGDIWVNSNPGHGSEFCFSVPLAPRSDE